MLADYKFTYPEEFPYSEGAEKVLGTKEEDLDKLLEQYNISRGTLETMITGIKDWYSKQPHLPQGQLHDRMILGQLIARGFRVEQSKEYIDNFFASRHKLPELLNGWYPLSTRMDRYLKAGYWLASPYTTEENHRILIFRLLDPTDFEFLDITRLGFLLRDYRMFNDLAIGEHWVMDFSKAHFSLVKQFTPVLLQKIYYYCTTCYAPKLKGIHIVNMPSYASSVLAIFKKLIKEKHASRLHMYRDYEELYKVLPREVFPKNLGGTADFECDAWAEAAYKIVKSPQWQGYIEHQDKYFRTDESKRTTPSNMNDLFGLDGSFRNLELD